MVRYPSAGEITSTWQPSARSSTTRRSSVRTTPFTCGAQASVTRRMRRARGGGSGVRVTPQTHMAAARRQVRVRVGLAGGTVDASHRCRVETPRSAGRGGPRMPAEIAVGPQKLVVNQGDSFLVSEQDGTINWPTEQGLYFSDTRLLSGWWIYADGQPFDLLNAGNIEFYAARIYLTNKALETEIGAVPAGVVALIISRNLTGGLHEDLDLRNNSQSTVQFNLEITPRCDFADLFEVKTGHIVRRGRIVTKWSERASRLTMNYQNHDFRRDLSITVRTTGRRPVYANGRISFAVRLEPAQTWHACLLYDVFDGRTFLRAPKGCIEQSVDSP